MSPVVMFGDKHFNKELITLEIWPMSDPDRHKETVHVHVKDT